VSDLRVGIIGLGGIAKVAHIPGYQAAGVKIAAVATRDGAAAEAVGRELGAAWSDDYRELLARDDIDAVSVCVPTYLHAEVTMAALRAGKHVFCEKPPGVTGAEAAAMAEVSAETGRLLMYAFSARYRRSNQKLKEWIGEGTLGEVYGGHTGWMRRRGNPAGWFTSREKAGGGPLIDLGIHGLDLTWWLMGCPEPVSVTGTTYYKFGNYEGADAQTPDPVMQIHLKEKAKSVYDVEDSAFAFIRFSNGAHLTLEASWALNCKKENRYVTLYGTKGGAEINPLEIFTDLHGTLADIRPEVAENNAYHEEVRHFAACLRGEERPISPAGQGVTVMRMIEAIYLSAESGREVRLDEAKAVGQ
jgi:predicted dehydrogenase